jgi:hypothetical protein
MNRKIKILMCVFLTLIIVGSTVVFDLAVSEAGPSCDGCKG